jgi:cytochrome c biogenesis protein CcdA
VVIFLGAALTVGNAWAEVFVWPTLTQIAPNLMSGSVTDMSSYLVAGLNLSFPLFGIGLILFGVATFRAGVYPRWVALLLIVSIPVTIFLDPTPGTFQESIGQILLGIAVAALGWHALKEAKGELR